MKENQLTWCAFVLCAIVLASFSRAEASSAPADGARGTAVTEAPDGMVHLAQAVATPATTSAAAAEPIGSVAKLTGSASVTRNNATTPLKLKDDIFRNDVLQTSAGSTLAVTFSDATTFSLTANSRMAIDTFVYADGGGDNAALFDVVKGTVAFVAAAVAKTGDMKIATPTSTLGIRGTTGLIEVPQGVTPDGQSNISIKLYPDADGKVGKIEVNDRAGARLGLLSQGATGFAIRPATGGARFAAVLLQISPQQAGRDQGIVRQVHLAQTFGRRLITNRLNELLRKRLRLPGLQNDPPKRLQPTLRQDLPTLRSPVQVLPTLTPTRPTIQIRPSMPR